MKIARRFSLLLAVAVAISASLMPQSSASVKIKAGSKCTKLNAKVTTTSRDIFQCKRVGKYLIWKLVGKAPVPSPYLWREEFNTPVGTAPNALNWTALIGNGWEQLGLWAFGTGELEQNSATAAATDGAGNMVITTTKTNGVWTSARYWTQGNINFFYGKIEARIKMPVGSFNWPAFWMLGSNYAPPNWAFGKKAWPMCGEIDIAEGLHGNEDYSSTIHANVQGTQRPWNNGGGLSAASNLYDAPGTYHTYGIRWQPNEITFTVDGYEIVTNTKIGRYVVQTVSGYEFNRFDAGTIWPFNQPFFLIINNAVSPSATNVADGANSKMYIDWIRYSKYQGYGQAIR